MQAPAYIKCLGNPEGPHPLACEWVGSSLAEAMGLQTLDFAILELLNEDVPFNGGKEEPGPAFATRAEEGYPWAGDSDDLRKLFNPGDIAKLVVLDTWLRNWDRHSPNGDRLNKDNVFLSQERADNGKLRLIAIDFSHAISHGKPIDSRLEHIDLVKDDRVYGLFPRFAPLITPESLDAAIQALAKITNTDIGDSTDKLPIEWEIGPAEKRHLRTFLRCRRDYLIENIYERISLLAGPQTAAPMEEQE